MNSFTTRVELRSATWNDYEVLHTQMAYQGFKRTVTGDNGVTYQLPTAEYRYDGYTTKWDILEKAKAAASATGRTSGIFVTEGGSWYCSGLQAVFRAA